MFMSVCVCLCLFVYEVYYIVLFLSREKKKKCLSCLMIRGKVVESDTGKFDYVHTFIRSPNAAVQNDFSGTELNCGDYVVVSTDTRFAVAGGIIKIITSDSLTIFLDRYVKM